MKSLLFMTIIKKSKGSIIQNVDAGRALNTLDRAKLFGSCDVCDGLVLILNSRLKTVECCGQRVKIGALEFRLMWLFASYPETPLSRERIKKVVWASNTELKPPSVNSLIQRLRKTLFREGWPDPIRNVRGLGYKLDPIYVIKNGPKPHKPSPKMKLKQPSLY